MFMFTALIAVSASAQNLERSKFFDNTFIGVSTGGGFWLHPSIRDFNFLELVLETKDYRARVDRMADSTYRYVSWKNKATMADTPDIILHNGIYNEESGDYSFKHGEYEYIVNENTGLVVKNKNKIILSQIRNKAIDFL